VPREVLSVQGSQQTIIDLTRSFPSNSNGDLPENISEEDPFVPTVPQPVTGALHSGRASPLITEGLVPSAVPNVAGIIGFDSLFEDTLPEVGHCVAEATTPSTAADIHPAQPAPTGPLPLKEANARNISNVTLQIRRFVDGLRAVPQGLVNWLLGESKGTSVSSPEPTPTLLPPGDVLAKDNIISETPSYPKPEVRDTTL
jgi:hypothetical protein